MRSTVILAILILGSGHSGFFALNMERPAQKKENLRDFSALPPGSLDYSFSAEKVGPAAVTIQEISGKMKGLLREVIVSMNPSNGNILVVFNKSKYKKQEYGQIWGVEGILQEDGS